MKKYFYKIAIWPLRWYWFIFRPVTHGVKCIIQKDGKVLFIQNTYGKEWWNLPGGGIRRNETAEQTVRREVQEEVGIGLKNLKKLGEFVNVLEFKRDNVQVFLAEPESDNIIPDPSEIKNYRWLIPSNLPQPISTVAKKALSLLGKKYG